MFQDAAGTTAVTAVEQPVSLMLDKRKSVLSDVLTLKYGSLPGTSGNYFSTPDSAANSITGDIDIRAYVAMDDWTPSADQTIASKFDAGTGNRCYFFRVQTDGTLFLLTNSSGTSSANNVSFASTVAPTIANGAALWVRVTLDVDNGASGKTATFYTSSNGTSWTQLGNTVTTAGTTSIFNGTNVFEVGAQAVGTQNNFAGKIHRVQLYNGINGTLAVDFCPPYGWASGTWASTLTSEVWTVNTSGSPAASVISLTTSGNHAYTPSSASTSRPVLSARVNVLERTEEFDDAAWGKTGSGVAVAPVVTANSGTAPDGSLTADRVQFDCTNTGSGANRSALIQSRTVVSGLSYTASVYVKAYDAGNVGKTIRVASDGISNTVVTLTADWQRIAYTGTTSVTSSNLIIETRGGSTTQTADALVWGADLRVTNDGTGVPSYQRVTTSTDYDTTGFPRYLRADGSDDYMLTPSIDFSASDKMTVVAGVRKLSDAAVGIVSELSVQTSVNNGAFFVAAPATAATNYGVSSRGTASANLTVSGYTAPLTSVLGFIGDIAGDISALRVNGSEVGRSATDQGTGNFGNYPLYLFRRGGSSLPFNGRFYGLVVRGAATDTATLQQTEQYLNGKTRAF
jgi:hypothetical protein